MDAESGLKYPVPVLTCGAFVISFSAVFVVVSHAHPVVSAFYRVFFGCICLGVACAIKGEIQEKAGQE